MRTAILTTSVILLAVTDAVSGDVLEPIARLSATGVLGFVVIWTVTKTVPLVLARMDTWEKQRAADSERLAETLNELKTHCEEATRPPRDRD
jgi:hypothetical protein